MIRKLSWTFGILHWVTGTGLFIAGNLFNTPVFEHLRGLYPNFFALPWWYWFLRSGIALLVLAGLVTALRTRSFLAALKVGALSGLISSSIGFVTWMGITIAFHDAMMKDPGNVHEYQLSTPTPPPTEQQLSDFIYADALEGSVIMMFEGPLAGTILGAIGGGGGMLLILAFRRRSRTRPSDLSAKMRSSVTPLPLHDSL
jgi:hypothetical protein